MLVKNNLFAIKVWLISYNRKNKSGTVSRFTLAFLWKMKMFRMGLKNEHSLI